MQKLSEEAKKYKQEYINEYNKKHYRRVSLNLTPSEYANVKACSDALGTSVNTFIKSAIHEKINTMSSLSKDEI